MSSPNANAAPRLLGITGSLYIVALAVYGTRVFARFRQRQLGWDDFTITFAMAFAIVEWSLIAAAAQYGFGRPAAYILPSDQIMARHLLFASKAFWTVCVLFVKVSIACTLLRLKHSRSWRIFLWTMIAVQVLSCAASLIFRMLQCDPMASMWDPGAHQHAVCVRQSAVQVDMYVHAGIGTATDFMLAAVPLSFILCTRRPLHEHLAISILVGLGVFATASSIVKTMLSSSTLPGTNTLSTTVDPTLWSLLEQQIGIIASCLPALKPLWDQTITRPGTFHSPDHHRRRHRHKDGQKPHPMVTGPFRLSLPHDPFPLTLNLVLPNPSTTTTSSILGRTTTPTPDRSEETVWPPTGPSHPFPLPTNAEVRGRDDAYERMMAEGGILLTTEFQLKSEVMSRASSDGGEGGSGTAMDRERQREIEEWRVERRSTDERVRGWDGV
ncbi:hypothetical protein K458DRAFT_365867 [Lentithecium fluviatile CBS 122367]|uniref:Rhodopsin domain-containing protein n=1 Tax=Lentithecium fluviatile CBS 122367 TaxID=1168545 RepID=A0A6G1J5G4_9PLEO|nr:hypothetical protein K458DRAFT_365867 [Lentithecium fluviatile CBS 122367]